MIIIQLQGGLGNQMFQYAHGCSLAKRYNILVKFDTSFLEKKPLTTGYTLRDFRLAELGLHNIVVDEKTMASIQTGIGKVKHKISRYFIHHKIKPISTTLLKGYWQSEYFFSNISDTIKKTFIFPTLKTSKALALQADINKHEHTISIHIRRGDYLQYKLHDVCTEKYYKNAMMLMKKKFPAAQFYLFSDDITFCKTLFSKNITYIEGTSSDIEDLYLMTQCKHSIISNSSFSWWGAWLGELPESHTITPNKWFNDEKLNSRYINDFQIIPLRWHPINV